MIFSDGLVSAVGAANALAFLLLTLYVLKTVLEYERRRRHEDTRLWYGVYSYSPISRGSSYYFPLGAPGSQLPE